jgi:hypothetical protein
MRLAIVCCLSLFLLTSPLHAQTEPSVTTVQTGGVQAVLIKPAKPIGSIILLAGGDGRIGVEAGGVITRQGNQLVRTRMAYARKGFAVLVPDRGYELAPLVDLMKGVKGPVTVVGTSRGTQWAAEGIAAGARPDKLVLTSGFLSEASTGEPPGRARPREEKNAISLLGSRALLPPTLIVFKQLFEVEFWFIIDKGWCKLRKFLFKRLFFIYRLTCVRRYIRHFTIYYTVIFNSIFSVLII